MPWECPYIYLFGNISYIHFIQWIYGIFETRYRDFSPQAYDLDWGSKKPHRFGMHDY